MADPTITAADVIAWNEMTSDTTTIAAVNLRIPLAQSYVNDQLNNSYVSATHGHEAEYKAACYEYVYYLYIGKPNFIGLAGIGQLKENTVDLVYKTENEIRKKEEKALANVAAFINIIKKAMEAVESDILDETGQTVNFGNTIYAMGVGGNKEYITDYGLGMQQDDDDLREELPNVQ
jgi:hypothetical protein